MSISFFRITPTDLQFIDNTMKSSPAGTGATGRAGAFGAEFHRDRAYSVVANLPKQVVERIVAPLQSINVAAGDTVVRQGTPADKFLIVVEGEAEVLDESSPQPVELASLGAGQLFGEVAIMRDQPRMATVRAKTDVKILALERDTFRNLIAQSMEITPDFDQVIRSRLEAGGSA
jgi:CRP-like cAMP-binding protein